MLEPVFTPLQPEVDSAVPLPDDERDDRKVEVADDERGRCVAGVVDEAGEIRKGCADDRAQNKPGPQVTDLRWWLCSSNGDVSPGTMIGTYLRKTSARAFQFALGAF